MRRRESSQLDSEDCKDSSLVEIGEEISDNDAECLYFSGLYAGQKRQKCIKCTKCYKWCHEECSGTAGFSETLNKCSALLHNTFILIFPLIQPLITFFDFPSINFGIHCLNI
jgi:hypothetical protein